MCANYIRRYWKIVFVCFFLQRLQIFNHRCVTVLSGQVDGPTALAVPGFRVGQMLHQEAHGTQMARPGRVVQRGGAGASVRYVGVRSVTQQGQGHRLAPHHHHLQKNSTVSVTIGYFLPIITEII